MNILSKILNAVGGGPSEQPPIPPVNVALGGKHDFTIQESSAALEKSYPTPKPVTPPPSVDAFERKWATLKGSAAIVPKKVIDAVITFGSLENIKVKTIAELKPFCEKYDRLNAQLADVNLHAVQSSFHKVHAENEAAVAAGNHEAVKPVLTRQAVSEEHNAKRGQIRLQKQAIVQAAQPTIEAFCFHVEAAARKLADEMEAREKAEAEKFGVAYAPSLQLVTVAVFALNGSKAPRNHHGAGARPGSLFSGYLEI
jgi:hypothetical protein